MSRIQPILQSNFSHPRDKFIKFYNRGHKYEITNDLKSKYTSVTTWNHKHFPKFDCNFMLRAKYPSK